MSMSWTTAAPPPTPSPLRADEGLEALEAAERGRLGERVEELSSQMASLEEVSAERQRRLAQVGACVRAVFTPLS